MTIKQIINYEYIIIQQTAEGGNDRKQLRTSYLMTTALKGSFSEVNLAAGGLGNLKPSRQTRVHVP